LTRASTAKRQSCKTARCFFIGVSEYCQNPAMEIQSLKIIRTFADEFLVNSLRFRFDICTCAVCKEAMLKRVMDDLHSQGLSLQGKNHDEIIQECKKDVGRAIIHAIDHISNHPPHSPLEDKRIAFKRLLEKISSDRGLELRNYHMELLKRRIALRLQHTRTRSYTEYIAYLSKNPSEYERLFETLCINVSEFFRDPPVWVTVQCMFENLGRLKMHTHDRTMSVWSCGCACGEEPYSLAIVISEALHALNHRFSVRIYATDIDKACLAAAPQGVYTKEAVKNLDAKLLGKYLDCKEGRFSVKEEIKKMVEFKYLDLTSQDYLRDMDVIVCRNVFIYFNRDLQKDILTKFLASLKPGGYLVMGRSETAYAEKDELFEVVDVNARIFRKPVEF